MTTAKCFTASEIAAYNATHTTPRKVVAAQAKWTPTNGRESFKYGEFPSRENRGHTAAQALENAMLHGEDA